MRQILSLLMNNPVSISKTYVLPTVSIFPAHCLSSALLPRLHEAA